MMQNYESKRLILKIIDRSFSQQVTDYYKRNRSFLEEWEAKRPEEFYTEEYQKQALSLDFEQIRNEQRLTLWIFKKEDPERIIGCVSFGLIIRGILQSCIMGYKLDAEEANKGYMTEALRKAIEVVFDEYKLHRIESPIMPKNTASLMTIQKLGFTNEGVSKEYMKVNGIWEDHIRWALINSTRLEG